MECNTRRNLDLHKRTGNRNDVFAVAVQSNGNTVGHILLIDGAWNVRNYIFTKPCLENFHLYGIMSFAFLAIGTLYSLSIIFTPRVHKFDPCQYFIPVFHSTDYWQPMAKWLRLFETITCTIPELHLMLPRKMQNNIGSALKFLFGH